MAQRLLAPRTTASKTARRCPCQEAHALDCAERADLQKQFLAVLAELDPLVFAQANGLFASLQALGLIDKDVLLADWISDRIYELSQAIHEAVFAGVFQSWTIQGEPDLMQAGGRQRTFHVVA